MTLLSLLLATKMAATALLVCLPFLLFSRNTLGAMLQLEAKSSAFFRLYGVAILALLVAYGFGLVQTLNGEFPWLVVTVGIVSNAGATLVLTFIATGRRNQLSAAFFGSIATLLVMSAGWPDFAMTRLLSAE